MLLHKLHPLIKRTLIVPIQIRQMDLQPPQPTFSKGLCLAKFHQPATEVVSHLVEVWGERVGPASEVDGVWEVECVVEELAHTYNQPCVP